MSERGPAAATFDFAGAYAAIDALYQERGWTDGLPIVAPTEAAVREFLGFTDREPREVVGVLPPRQGEATVERIAVNAVMAGCRPEYFPVLLAAIEALADPAFNLDSIQATTHPVAPLLVVNGPIAREIGLNAGYNAFGQGARANVTIGRAVRLVLMNVGGGLPGTGDRATQGSPAKLAYCVAENEAESPWLPLHVERGFRAEQSAVTVMAADAPHQFYNQLSSTAEGILTTLSDDMRISGNVTGQPQYMLILAGEHMRTIAKDGWTKARIRQYVWEHTHNAHAHLKRTQRMAGDIQPGDETRMRPLVETPDDILVVAAGGRAGAFSAYIPGWGSKRSSQAVTKEVKRP